MGDVFIEAREEDVVVEELKPKLKEPPMYRVVIYNDDFTPMDFVVDVLERFFFMTRERATSIMLEVHTKGKGICGVYARDVAETKVSQVNGFSRDREQPLMCNMEPC